MAGRGKGNFSPQEIRERVSRVMDVWQSYPDFAHFFTALMDANDISDAEFAQQYSQATGTYISGPKLAELRHGNYRPTYEFVANIADHALLSLDPEKMKFGGDHRIAFFTAAGLIEVTPDSIKQWNEEVLAGWQRQRDRDAALPRTTWKELMAKLLSFHRQGGRWTHRDISDAVNALSGSNGQPDVQRIEDILSNQTAVSTHAERQALGKVAGLDSAQINAIETAIDDGILLLTPRPQHSRFSAQLRDILDRLHAFGISQRQLALRTVPLGQTEPELSTGALSMCKNGKTNPTQATMRVLVKALDRCRDGANRPLVMADEIRQLVSAAGFTLDDLTATTHDIVAHIDGGTRLKPLLCALRNAADLNVPMSAIDSHIARDSTDDCEVYLAPHLPSWERDGSPNTPNPAQVRQIITRYNRLLRDGGKAELTDEEIQRVTEVAQRDRENGEQRGFVNRAREHHPRTPRRTISPDFGDGSSR